MKNLKLNIIVIIILLSLVPNLLIPTGLINKETNSNKIQIPNDSDTVSFLKIEINSEIQGPSIGEIAPNFTVFSINKQKFNLYSELKKGKPVLLVTGSYTCPIYRIKLDVINDVYNRYSNLLNIIVVYGAEAHPVEYNDEIRLNIEDNIYFNAPKTYLERKLIAKEMLENLEHKIPLYIDNPNNSVLNKYGYSPNSSYIIGLDGIVLSSHDMFHQGPKHNIYKDIISLFNLEDY